MSVSSRVASPSSQRFRDQPQWLRPTLSALSLCVGLSLGCRGGDSGGAAATGGTSPSGTGGTAGAAGVMSTGGTAASNAAAGMGQVPTAGGGGAGGSGSGGSGGEAGSAGSAGAGGDGSGAGAAGGVDGGGDAGDVGIDKSSGCGNEPLLASGTIMVRSSDKDRSYVLRLPDNYDKDHPYRLILGFHGAFGTADQVAPQFFGLWDLAEGSTIFVAANGLNQDGMPTGTSLYWYNEGGEDVTYIDDIVEQVEAALCIDKQRIALEGFSMGGAMVWTAACARPGKFSAAVVHSGGSPMPRPASCDPIPFMSSLGAQESNGAGQTSNSDFFAMEMGCMVQSLPKAPDGGHACNNYPGCPASSPVRWCDYDGGHMPDPRDAGESMSWMPAEVWQFVDQF